MAIFDLDKDDLCRLSDSQLEELIARLAETEVAAHGHSPAYVNWSGSINAPDGGIDVHVKVPVENLSTGFIERPDTIFQAKKPSMPKSAITDEMTADGKLSAMISEQASKSGSYIIVSLDDDCSPPMKQQRLDAMRDAVGSDTHSHQIHLDFYDRSKLAQWLRQHPSVMLWAKECIGQGYSGWRSYGAWSNPPQGAVDTLIVSSGVNVTLPAGKGRKLSIEDAINPMRDLIRSTNKAIRIIGLSGVGKTRIVQALFDETVGMNALDRTIAVYVDAGAEPNPSATAMLDRLIADDRRAVLVLDNCPSDLHSALASKVSTASSDVRLITVEYDIREDKPQTTEVIHIEAVGTDVAEQLLQRRFPGIGQNNAHRIAQFAAGNARVALAIAERVGEGESLAQLSDAQLFNRLFEQRNEPDTNRREQAEILSLVYSFSMSDSVDGCNELDVLGSIAGYTRSQLFRSVGKLMGRQVVQKRAHWRAILPQAIANRLAATALDGVPVDQLRAAFEAPGRQRLLMSFAHRLGLLYDHPVAKEIVEAWLQPNGLLGRITALDDKSTRMLSYVGLVAPDALLDRIEAVIDSSDFVGMEPRNNPQRTTILNLLQALAYEPPAFERCVRLLIRVADFEDEHNNFDAVRPKIIQLFQAYLSGTHASLNQRIAIMEECLSSGVADHRALGFKMLSTALDGPPWRTIGINEFGARPRDFGTEPDHEELVAWRSAFIDVAVRLGTSDDSELEGTARQILANEFRGMWAQGAMRKKLTDAAYKLHALRSWVEGWKAIRLMIYFEYTGHQRNDDAKPLPDDLAALERTLEPKDLLSNVMAYVFSAGGDYWMLDDDLIHDDANTFEEAEKRIQAKALQLGEAFAVSDHEFGVLGQSLFSSDGMPYRIAFGRGLAKGALDAQVYWQQLVDQLELHSVTNKSLAIFAGFIEEISRTDHVLAQQLLDQCAQHPELRSGLVGLHPWGEFTETDLNRCMSVLDDSDIHAWIFRDILWHDRFIHLPEGRVIELAWRLLNKPNGDDVVLEALSLRLHGKAETMDALGYELRQVGLRAVIQRLRRDRHDSGGHMDYRAERVVGAALRFEGNESTKMEWIDTIFAAVDADYGYFYAFEKTIETTAGLMLETFLNYIFEADEKVSCGRLSFICHDYSRRPLLAKVDVGALIDWCRNKNDPSVWTPVALGIDLWSEDQESKVVSLSSGVIRLLETVPEPGAILEGLGDHVAPSSWSGSRADVMQLRTDAIGRLVDHKNVAIAEAARTVCRKLAGLIDHVRLREQQEDEGREQRFE